MWLGKKFVALTETVTMLLVMKDKEGHSIKSTHEEEKAYLEYSKGKTLGDSNNNDNVSSTSNISSKVEEKLEIPTYDSQLNDEN